MSHPSGQPPYGQYPPAPEHPTATTAMVLGILSLVLCSVIGPFAWSIGGRVVREIDASRGQYGGRGMANAGRIMGMIATILLGLSLLLLAVLALGTLASVSTGY